MGNGRSFDRHAESRPPTDGRSQNDKERKPPKTSFSTLVDFLKADCAADREEFFKREREQKQTISHSSQQTSKKQGNHYKAKPTSFQEQLDLTNFWLEETFPKLFAADDYVPLDLSIVRDLKRDYKKKRFKQGYPKSLVIESAISQYKKSYGYLLCLEEGAPRYNLEGGSRGTATKEEHEAARKILATL